MRFLWKYLKKYRWMILGGMGLKLAGTLVELLIPYVMEHLLDHVVPRKETAPVLLWGAAMIALACIVRFLNVTANRRAVRVAKENILRIRQDLFHAALNLSGRQTDEIGLPSLISRMTSDTYNVQSFIQSVQTLGIRAPIMLLGGIAITLTMDPGLALILCIMAPVMIGLVVFISYKGIPLYDMVQHGMDDIVRVMHPGRQGAFKGIPRNAAVRRGQQYDCPERHQSRDHYGASRSRCYLFPEYRTDADCLYRRAPGQRRRYAARRHSGISDLFQYDPDGRHGPEPDFHDDVQGQRLRKPDRRSN